MGGGGEGEEEGLPSRVKVAPFSAAKDMMSLGPPVVIQECDASCAV